MKVYLTRTILALVLVFAFYAISVSQSVDQSYKMPPKEIADIIDAPPTPSVSFSPDNKWMMILGRFNLPPIDEVAREELRIAGIRIDPATNGPSRARYYNSLTFKKIGNDDETAVTGIPESPKIQNYSWSPDGKYVAFTITETDGLYLWLTEIKSGKASKLSNAKLNDAYGSPYYWLSDSKSLICRFIPGDRGAPPVKNNVPTGPVIQENLGSVSAAATYADLLKDAYDESLFEYFLTTQITKVDLDGKTVKLGSPGLHVSSKPSPDGNFILVGTIHKPYSYLVRIGRFPRLIEIWDIDGNKIREIVDQPLAEDIPVVSGAVRKGPRSIDWRNDQPATIFFVEALDDGDPRNKVPAHDQLYYIAAPFKGNPIPLISTELRFYGIDWCNEKIALLYDYWWPRRQVRVHAFAPNSPEVSPELMYDYSWQDKYNDPGNPLKERNEYGRSVLQLVDSKFLLYTGSGASDEGDRPFIDAYDLEKHEATRLWRSEAPYYESVYRAIDTKNLKVITRRESISEPPNYFLRDVDKNSLTQLTSFPHPAPIFKDVSYEMIKYKRDDGLDMSGKLYLPPGYKESDGPLPLLLWAYPEEFKSTSAAGQVKGSPYRFIRVGWWSPALWLLSGFAVLDYPSMPIIGEGDTEPNDSFIEQLVANSKAAINAVVAKGVADPDRVAIGGHSYGAFMTANLLAHSDLFRAGIARTGAYNRTLTPFGFQNEERSFWEAPEIYFAMSPFMHADKVNKPILLIHGTADNNPGTFPMQSERFFNALKGHGAICRLVMLPHESHSYRARENVMHMLYETNNWLEKYVKNAGPREVSVDSTGTVEE